VVRSPSSPSYTLINYTATLCCFHLNSLHKILTYNKAIKSPMVSLLPTITILLHLTIYPACHFPCSSPNCPSSVDILLSPVTTFSASSAIIPHSQHTPAYKHNLWLLQTHHLHNLFPHITFSWQTALHYLIIYTLLTQHHPVKIHTAHCCKYTASPGLVFIYIHSLNPQHMYSCSIHLHCHHSILDHIAFHSISTSQHMLSALFIIHLLHPFPSTFHSIMFQPICHSISHIQHCIPLSPICIPLYNTSIPSYT
jgi:hypothetical protein